MKRHALLFVLCCATALHMAAAELPVVPLLRHGIIADGVGFANLVTADLTGDARPEIVSCSFGAPFALEYRAGDYPQLWYGPSVGCSGVTIGDANGDGATDVIVVGSQGLFVFDPRGLGSARAHIAVPSAVDVAFGNVDFDAEPEIVVAGTNATYVYDAATLALQWTASGYGATGVLLGDVDGDARNEIVLESGYVLDGGNAVMKWGYAGGFRDMALGDVDADAKLEIVFVGSPTTTVTVLNGDTMTTSTVTGFSVGIEHLTVADANSDGTNEIVAGNNQWGSISARRVSDSALLWHIENPENGCMAVAVADVDGDGVREVLWGAGHSSSGRDALFVGNPLTQTIEWDSVDLDGPMFVAAGDVDGDGRAEVAMVTYRSDSGYEGAILKLFDAVSGTVKWEQPEGYSGATQVNIAQLDADPALEVAVYTDSTIRVFDGVTGAVEWTSPAVTRMVVANVDADPVSEIITLFDGKLVVMDGISNIIQSSRVFSAYPIAAGDVTGDGIPEVIAASFSSLYVLSSSTLATMASSSSFGGVSIAAVTAEEGGRIAVSGFSDELHLLDATLTEQWSCYHLPNNIDYTAVTFGTIAGQSRLLVGDGSGVLRAGAFDGNVCPAFDTTNLGSSTLYSLVSTDVTGDGRAEIVAGTTNSAGFALIGLPEEMRGDVNGDAVIAPNDIDQLVDSLFGAATSGLSTGADANADERLSGEDAFALVHYVYSGGSLP